MKFIKAIIFAAIAWFPIFVTIYTITGRSNDPSLVVASIISVIIFFIVINKDSGGSGATLASAAIGKVKDIKDEIELNLEEKSADFYAQAEEEYDNGEIDKGLWSQALVKAKGDENLRKVEYMKLRVKQLKKKV